MEDDNGSKSKYRRYDVSAHIKLLDGNGDQALGAES